jgi:hypothetical protein
VTYETCRETVRLALLAAVRVHSPDHADGHVTWGRAAQTFGSAAGVVELREVSMVTEAERTTYDGDERTYSEAYRVNVDVCLKQAGSRQAHQKAMQIRNALRRLDVRSLLGEDVAVSGALGPLVTVDVTSDGRSETWTTFEVPFRMLISHTGATETPTTVGTVEVLITAAPDFEDVPVVIEEG